MGVGMMCSFPSMGFLTERFGCQAIAATGALLALLGMLPFLWMVQNQLAPVWAVIGLFVAGAWQGVISIPSVSAAYASVPKDQLAVANTALNIVQRVGAPLATTIISAVMSSSSSLPTRLAPHPFVLAFELLVCLHLAALLTASRLPAQIGQKLVAARA